ncbi:MAG TPA: hypothetical protein VHB99_02795, partial [Pirellulales bacterium]|nr:hypothetical protein [Pirellulales bacterium]
MAIPTPTPIVADVRLSLHDGPPSLSGKSTYWFGLARVPASKRNRRRHCDFHFHDTPVSLLSLAHEYDSTSHWDGDVLTIEFQERRLKFDATTGRLIEYEAAEEGSQLRVSVASGQFELKLAEIDEAARDLPNDAPASAGRPVSSILEFLAEEAVEFDDCEALKEFRPQLRLLRKLVSLGLLKPLDRLGAASFQYAAESDEFSIPGKPADFYVSESNFTREWFHDPKTQAKLRDLAAAGGLHAARFLLPAEGWPQAVFREAVFAQADKGSPADRAVDLTKLCASPAAGPLCCLSASAAATEWPLGAPASLFANLGKTKLTLAEFQNDYRPLLDDKSLVGEYLLCLADVLRGLEAEEVETLLAMLKTTECLDQPSLDALSAVAAVLRQHREGPVDQALAASLDQLWQLGLREQLAKWLDQLADEPKSPTVPAAPAAPRVAVYGVYQAAPYKAKTEPYGAPATADAAKESNSPPLALEGFCPVTLMEKKAWHEGDTRYSAVHQGQIYVF